MRGERDRPRDLRRLDDRRTRDAHAASGGGAGVARVEAGHVFGERYRVLSLLGSGGMGQVFRVEDATSGQALALKVLRPLDGDDGDRVRRFQREIQILTRIRHPAVLHILDWGDSPAGLYFVTELVDGEDLKAGDPSPRCLACGRGGGPRRHAGRRARCRARARRRPPRRQAQQRHDRARRLGAAARLRPRPRRRHRPHDAHPHRHHPRDARLHVPRAVRRPRGRRAQRPLLARRRLVRGAHRAAALHGSDADRGGDRPQDRDAAAASFAAARASPPGSSASSCAASRRTRRGASRRASELAAELRRPREGAPARSRALPSGDGVVLDPARRRTGRSSSPAPTRRRAGPEA